MPKERGTRISQPQHEEERVFGSVVRVMNDKGFGFIKDAEGKEYFFHRSAVQQGYWESVQTGMNVTFLARAGEKGPRAEDVQLA